MANGQSPRAVNPLVLNDHDIERRKRFVDLQSVDLARIASVRDLVVQSADQFSASFFNYLADIGEAGALFSNPTVLEEARRLKREHLAAMVAGDYGQHYVEQRLRLGMLYSTVGLDVRVFLGAFHHLMLSIGSEIMKQPGADPQEAFQRFMSLKKVGFFDIAIIVDVLIDERQRTIALQQDAIRELSTPVLQVRDRLLVLPIIGVIDTQRARQLTDSLLHAIRSNRAKVVVMDITGVAAVDSKVANHLIQTVAAARLMGASVIVTGLSADVAQSLVALGVDLSKVNTVGDLQGGLEEAERLLGYKVTLQKGDGSRSGAA
jgi:rsbT co-antagonist protein RsbR